MMLQYQKDAVNKMASLLPKTGKLKVLEIGSDVSGLVSSALAEKTGSYVVGINPVSNFPQQPPSFNDHSPSLLRGDGRHLPFSDNSFDCVFSIATMEHVNGLGLLLDEVNRVLRPKGFFYANFSPIWSCATGHHVYAVSESGAKEARFWKAGRNPVPDYAHLYMNDDELRDYLAEGPCSQELIEPIVEWIYHGDSINRYHFEDYVKNFKNSPLLIQQFVYKSLNDTPPDDEIKVLLVENFGPNANFSHARISVMLRKADNSSGFIKSYVFNAIVYLKYISNSILFNSGFLLLKRFPELKKIVRKFIKLYP